MLSHFIDNTYSADVGASLLRLHSIIEVLVRIALDTFVSLGDTKSLGYPDLFIFI